MIWFNVTNVIQIDGEVSADGLAGSDSGSGGGSGGSIWMHCYRMKGVNVKLDFPDGLYLFCRFEDCCSHCIFLFYFSSYLINRILPADYCKSVISVP